MHSGWNYLVDKPPHRDKVSSIEGGDATHKTTRYLVPLFFLVVKANVDYQNVGTFVCEGESTENITEALNIIKDWNPGWKPLYFMTNYSDEEITSIETLFPGNSIYKYRELKEKYKLVKIVSEKKYVYICL